MTWRVATEDHKAMHTCRIAHQPAAPGFWRFSARRLRLLHPFRPLSDDLRRLPLGRVPGEENLGCQAPRAGLRHSRTDKGRNPTKEQAPPPGGRETDPADSQ